MRSRIAIIGLIGALLALPGTAPGQEEPRPSDAGSEIDVAALEARRAELAEQIAGLRSVDPTGPAAERLGWLERSERLVSQVLEEAARSEDFSAREQTARLALAGRAEEALGHAPPYTVEEYDAAVDGAQAAARAREESVAAARSAADALEGARTEVEAAERAGRAGGEADVALAPLRVEAAKLAATLGRLQLRNARLAEKIQALESERARTVLEWLTDRVVARAEEFDRRSAEFDARTARLTQARERAELRVQSARGRWERAATAAENLDASAVASREAAARRAELGARQKEVALLGEQLDRVEHAREVLRRRFAFFGTPQPPRAELAAWAEEARTTKDGLTREAGLDRAEQSALSLEVERIAAEEAGPWTDVHLTALRDTVALYADNLASIEAALASEARLLESLDRKLRSFDLMERLVQLRAVATDVWSFEVASSDDRSITVGRISIGLFGFLVGILLARILTHGFGSRLFARLGVDEGAAHAYQSLAFYALLGVAFLTALRMVDIPLTAFAVVGGALAIGIGFGSQNIVNNFISGVILLAERPIKRGDLVQLEDTYGNVERIGLRSTRLRTGENIHVIVPNAAFLENRVINWTHTDPQVRIKVTVGIVYGSPTREAARILGEVIEAHEKVLATPAPIILFKGFGDNSLDFEAHFWVLIRSQMERMRIESDIRFSIDDRFREAGIVIAFPQRDVHLDASQPIPIRLTGGPETQRGDP